jgi:hypothetical protein
MKTVVALVAAGVVFCGVAVREWSYRSSHPYALGPSGELIALAVGGAVIAFALAAYVHRRDDDHERTERALWGRIGELHAEIRGLTIAELELRQIEQEIEDEDTLLGEPGT